MRLGHEELHGRIGHDAGRALLARLYREETGLPLPEILTTPQGKPYFPNSHWHFSISHTKNHVFCCLCRQNVGIDAEECHRPVRPELFSKILSPAEQSRCGSDGQALLRLWVLKEAYAKLTGRGLGDYLFSTDFSPEDPRIQTIFGCYAAILTEDDYAV